MKMNNGSTIFGTFALAAVLMISFLSTTAHADLLSAKITNKILNEHSANMRAGILPHPRQSNKILENRVEGAKTVASAVSLGAPVMNQHPSDEVEPARGPKHTGRFIPRKK